MHFLAKFHLDEVKIVNHYLRSIFPKLCSTKC